MLTHNYRPAVDHTNTRTTKPRCTWTSCAKRNIECLQTAYKMKIKYLRGVAGSSAKIGRWNQHHTTSHTAAPTPQNTTKHRKTSQDTTQPRTTPQNTTQHRKTAHNTAQNQQSCRPLTDHSSKGRRPRCKFGNDMPSQTVHTE
jgi:hypothetical protein